MNNKYDYEDYKFKLLNGYECLGDVSIENNPKLCKKDDSVDGSCYYIYFVVEHPILCDTYWLQSCYVDVNDCFIKSKLEQLERTYEMNYSKNDFKYLAVDCVDYFGFHEFGDVSENMSLKEVLNELVKREVIELI